MKKLIAVLLMVFAVSVGAFAQHVVEKKDKVRHTSTVGQKIHNVFHKKKHYSGYKVKHKEVVSKH